MCDCVYNKRGFLEIECFACVEAAADAEAFEPPMDETEGAHNLEQSIERGVY